MQPIRHLAYTVLITTCFFGCTSDAPARPPTAVPVAPTVPRPPLVAPSPVVSPIPSPSPAPTSDTYTVAPGDTLTSIAERFLGDASAWQQIFLANRDRLESPEALQVGMIIRIPPRSPR